MQKYHFFILPILLMNASILGMEISKDTIKKTFIVNLGIRKRTDNDVDNFLTHDKHACNVLGIKWEDDSQYRTNFAFLHDINNPKEECSWDILHPTFLPQSTMLNEASLMPGNIHFPKILPTQFVEELREKGSITLERNSFEQPVTIIVQLDQQNSHNTQEKIQDLLDTINEFPSTPTDTKQTTDNPTHKLDTQKIGTAANPTPKSTSYKAAYILTGITAAGFIALIIYLYKNNHYLFQYK